MSEHKLAVAKEGGSLVVKGGEIAEAGENWKARQLDERRLLLSEGDADLGGDPLGMASYPIEIFKDFLVGLIRTRWSGVVAVDTGVGVKRIFFSGGSIVFAASSIMDDRLGEVIYREAQITLDELTDSAAQVTKSRKFGQVLLANHIFTNPQLWDALKMQVRQILRSCFMTDRVYFEMQPGITAPTEIVFHQATEELLSDFFSFGCAFRAFLSRLRAESMVVLQAPKEVIAKDYPPGTFVGDLLALVSAQPNVQDLLNTSKLIDHYTIAALLALVNSGHVKLIPEVEADKRYLPPPGPLMAPLKARIDAYAYVLGAVRKAFQDASKEFPQKDLVTFVAALNSDGFTSVFLDATLGLSRDSVTGMFSQCATNAARVIYFTMRIDSMIQFLMQVAGDNLEFAVAKKIRQEYRAVSA